MRQPPGRARARSLRQLDDDEALLGHLAHRVVRALARVTGVLDPAVGHLIGAERRRLVHGHAAELELLRCPQCVVQARGEDAGLQPVAGAVCKPDRLVDGVDRSHRADRSEDFLAGDLVLETGVRDHRRPDQLALQLAAGQHLSAARLDPPEDALARVLIYHGADVRVLVGRIADLQRLDQGNELVHELVVRTALHVDPLHGDAALAGKANAFCETFVAAVDTSASAATISGVALPSSRFTRFFGARSFSFQPTPLEPVNVISLPRSSSTRTSPISGAGPTSTLSQPGGSPASSSSSARNSADRGVWLAGLSTTAQPAASAGAILCATRLSGKLNGLMAPTTPIGRRRVNASFPSPACAASIGTISPESLRASTAANV